MSLKNALQFLRFVFMLL